MSKKTTENDRGGIQTHATEVTGALNQHLRPLDHLILAGKCLYMDALSAAYW